MLPPSLILICQHAVTMQLLCLVRQVPGYQLIHHNIEQSTQLIISGSTFKVKPALVSLSDICVLLLVSSWSRNCIIYATAASYKCDKIRNKVKGPVVQVKTPRGSRALQLDIWTIDLQRLDDLRVTPVFICDMFIKEHCYTGCPRKNTLIKFLD